MCQRTHTKGEHNMLSMEMDAVDIINIIKIRAPIPSQRNTHTHTHAADPAQCHEDGSHGLAGVLKVQGHSSVRTPSKLGLTSDFILHKCV